VRPYRWRLLRPLYLLAWRIREREVNDAGDVQPETRGAPSYKRGKVTGLVPDLLVITETSDSSWVCCGYCSAAMASWTARTGIGHSMGTTAHPIRSAGGRPHNNGSRASELRDGAKGAHGVKLEALAVDEIRDTLRAGHAVVINLDYAQLPDWLRVQGGSFGHSCTLYGIDEDLVGFFDPLWPENARGAWATWDEIRGALWGDGEHSGTVVSWGTPTPPPPDPPEPECPDCPPAEEHTEQELRQLIAQGEAAGYQDAVQDRDAAWRWYAGAAQPRLVAGWSSAGEPGTRWSWFGRWGPELEPSTWNGPWTAWGQTTWADPASIPVPGVVPEADARELRG